MKICWLIADDRGGGVASVAVSCIRQAQAAGHDSTLLLLLPSTGWIEKGEVGFKLDSLGKSPAAAEAPAALLSWLDANPQDIVVLNGCEEVDGAIPYLPSKTRVIYAVHDTASRYWEAALLNEADLDGIVAVSQTVAGEFEHKLRERKKLRVIHNGTLFPPAPHLAADRPRDLLFLCGDNPTKGAYDLLKLWEELARRDFKGNLHWFGRVESSFARRVAALPGSDRIQMHGRAPRSDVFAAAARSRVFLMLSRVEPFGMVTIEAMGMGTVPVAWDLATGTREIVQEGISGFFVPLGDFKGLAVAIKLAIATYPEIAEASMKRARLHFGEENMWAGYSRLLTELPMRPEYPRSRSGQVPPIYKAPRRRFQSLPEPLRRAARNLIGASPRIGYWLRDLRGW